MKAYHQILKHLDVPVSGQDYSASTDAAYFLGIGGIGMSAIARYFNSLGVKVSGYDKTPTELTKKLEAEGIKIHYEDNTALVDKTAQLVVFTPAVPAAHQELNYFRDHNYTVVKRSDVLGAITNSSFNICVAGTHGKTTTSTMVAHILRHSEFGCNAFLGGISGNYNSNFWSSENNVAVVEADEYDRSFLKLSPDVAIITSMDPDHLDIYGTPEAMEQAFIDFSTRVKPNGLLISKHGLKRGTELSAANQLTYDVNDDSANASALNIQMNNGSYQFDVRIADASGSVAKIENIVLNMGGMHNIENALAAIIVAKHVGISEDEIRSAVAAFKGVKRRFEYIVKEEAGVFIDDYAHHPAELKALITGAKELFPGKKCTVVFQPHLFSRTKDFSGEFAAVLDLADEVILLPIYPARELPMAGVSSQLILDAMQVEDKRIMDKEALLDYIRNNEKTFLITAGAGDIDRLVTPLKAIIQTAVK
ncbi:MAG: UDP-N-acetylmuramate--L-alanine ligase [Ferruginibacter sp.]|nr:UDP-N-acetylmuramate--L-alanine ligase [Ferruginibacter sp.]